MFFVGGSWQASSWQSWACFCYGCAYFYYYYFFKILTMCLYIYIYILVIGNIMNKSLFMQVEIAKTCYYSAKLQ